MTALRCANGCFSAALKPSSRHVEIAKFYSPITAPLQPHFSVALISLGPYSFGRLVQGFFGLTIRAMSCIICHDPGMLAPVFTSTTMVMPSAGR